MINLKKKYPVNVIFDLVEKLYFEIREHKEFHDKFFKGIQMTKLIRIQKETFAYIFGYSDKNPNINLFETHKNLNIEEADWLKFVEITTKVLNDASLPQDEIQFILEKVSNFKNEIVKN